MAIIYTYPNGPSPLTGEELIIISDPNNSNSTRNVTAQAIADLNDFEITLDASSTGLSFDDTLKPGFYTVNLSGIVNTSSGGTGLGTIGSANQVLTSNGSSLFYQTGIDGPVLFDAKANEVLAKGDVVYIDGFDVGAGLATVSKADASDANKMPAYGLALQAAPGGNEEIQIVTFGDITGLNTSSFSAGEALYVDTTPGDLTNTPPATEANLIQNIGKVERAVGGTNGIIKVGGAGRTNATPNLNEGSIFIGDTSNRSSILPISATPGDVLTSDGTTASWAAIPTQAAEDLATTLAAGNTTGANDISVDPGQGILFNEAFVGTLNSSTLTVGAKNWSLPDESGIIPVGPAWDTLIANPTVGEDGYVITWDNTAGEYQLLAAGAGLNGIYTGSGSLITDTVVTSANFDLTVNEVSTVRPSIFNVLKGTPPFSKIQDVVASFDWNGVATGFSTTVQISNSVDTGSGSPATALKVNAGAGTLVGQRNGIISSVASPAGGPMIGITSIVLGGTGVPANSDVAIAAVVDNRTGVSEPNTYGVWSSVSNPAASVITSGYFSATNGTLNYAIIAENGQSGFGTTTPDPSAIVDVFSTTQGFKVPVVNGTGTVSPAPTAASAGLIIFDSTTNEFAGYNGTSWINLDSPSLRNVSATTTFLTPNETINCTANTFTVNLPTAVGIQGTTYTLVNSGTGVITLDADGAETINGSLTIDLATQYISRTVQSDGTNWIII